MSSTSNKYEISEDLREAIQREVRAEVYQRIDASNKASTAKVRWSLTRPQNTISLIHSLPWLTAPSQSARHPCV